MRRGTVQLGSQVSPVSIPGAGTGTWSHGFGRKAVAVMCFDAVTGAQVDDSVVAVTQPDDSTVVFTSSGAVSFVAVIRFGLLSPGLSLSFPSSNVALSKAPIPLPENTVLHAQGDSLTNKISPSDWSLSAGAHTPPSIVDNAGPEGTESVYRFAGAEEMDILNAGAAVGAYTYAILSKVSSIADYVYMAPGWYFANRGPDLMVLNPLTESESLADYSSGVSSGNTLKTPVYSFNAIDQYNAQGFDNGLGTLIPIPGWPNGDLSGTINQLTGAYSVTSAGPTTGSVFAGYITGQHDAIASITGDWILQVYDTVSGLYRVWVEGGTTPAVSATPDDAPPALDDHPLGSGVNTSMNLFDGDMREVIAVAAAGNTAVDELLAYMAASYPSIAATWSRT